MDIKFTVQLVHGVRVLDDQHQEHIDRSLLRKPEAQFETEELDLIEFIYQQYAAAIGDNELDSNVGKNQSQVSGPVGAGVFFFHYSSLCVIRKSGHPLFRQTRDRLGTQTSQRAMAAQYDFSRSRPGHSRVMAGRSAWESELPGKRHPRPVISAVFR